jgi:hypothetical protein
MISKTALLAPGWFASALYEMTYPDEGLVRLPSLSRSGQELRRVENSTSLKQSISYCPLQHLKMCVQFNRLNNTGGETRCPFRIISTIFEGNLLEAEEI